MYLRQQKATKQGSASFVRAEIRNGSFVATLSTHFNPVSVQIQVKMKRSSLVALCLLVCTSLALDCEWDEDVKPEQGLTSVDAAMIHLDQIREVPGPEECRAACCTVRDCDLALVTYLADGRPQCMLVNCMMQDRDVCHFEPNTQSRVYRKKGKRVADRPAEESEETVHVVPFMASRKTGTNETSNKMPSADFAERCEAAPEVGPCRAAFQHWYYNSETASCQSFIYGGCRGNKNNYVSKESCMATCGVKVLPSSKKAAADDIPTEYKDDCMATSDPGPCRAAFPMFYYDPNTATCQSFIYGGCRGNKNRYGTMDECMKRCSQDGAFDTHGKARDHWTAGVFLFITLAIISALLLATLVVITVRRHNLSHRPSSISDKEELLPDLDEQSSMESLAITESPKPDKA